MPNWGSLELTVPTKCTNLYSISTIYIIEINLGGGSDCQMLLLISSQLFTLMKIICKKGIGTKCNVPLWQQSQLVKFICEEGEVAKCYFLLDSNFLN